MRPSRTLAATPVAVENYSHTRCYARSRADCSKQLSSEHFLSRALLERIESATGGIHIRGFPWQKAEVERVGINSLAAKVLCTRHNSQLSPLDSEAVRLVEMIERCHSPQPGIFLDSVSGDKIQRYLLKVLCGALAGRSARHRGTRILSGVPEEWVGLLFGDQPFPDGWGLKLGAQAGERWDDDPNSYIVAPVMFDDHPIGLRATLRRFRLLLIMTDPGPHPIPAFATGRLFRPTCIDMSHRHGKCSIQFRW